MLEQRKRNRTYNEFERRAPSGFCIRETTSFAYDSSSEEDDELRRLPLSFSNPSQSTLTSTRIMQGESSTGTWQIINSAMM